MARGSHEIPMKPAGGLRLEAVCGGRLPARLSGLMARYARAGGEGMGAGMPVPELSRHSCGLPEAGVDRWET